MRFLYINRFFFIGIILFLFMWSRALPNQGDSVSVGIIIQTKGDAKIVRNEKNKTAYPLTPIYSDMKLITGKKASLRFSLCPLQGSKKHEEYIMDSNSQVVFQEGKPLAIKGKVSLEKSDNNNNFPLDPYVSSQKIMTIMVRNFNFNLPEITYPLPGEHIALTDRITFLWKGIDTKEIEIVIREKDSLDIEFRSSADGTSGQWTFLQKKTGGEKPKTEKNKKDKSKSEEKTRQEDVKTLREEKTENIYTNEETSEKKDFIFVSGKSYTISLVDPDPFTGTLISGNFTILSQEENRTLQEQENICKKSIEKNKKDIWAYFVMVDLYKSLKMYSEFLKTAKTMREKDPDNPYVYYLSSELYGIIGDREEAEANFRIGCQKEGIEYKTENFRIVE